jgi:hypothetical protein
MSFYAPGPRVPSTSILKSLTVTERANIEEMDIKRINVLESIKVGSILIGGNYITGLNDPIQSNGAATKNYVDGMIGPTVWKAPCRLATTILENLSLSGLPIIDGIQTIIGNRILVKNQTNGIDNGYYVVSSGSWSRTSDMPNGRKVAGYTTIVQEGSDNEDTAWFCINDEDSDTVGTNILVFSKFSSYDIAGAGLSKSGSILNVNTDNSTIYVDTNNDLSLTNTTVTAGTYGSSTQVSSFNVDSQGRITNAQNTNIQDASSLQKGLVTTSAQTFSGIKTFTEIHTDYLSGLLTPVGNSDAANKSYVDAVASGINWTEPVRVISVVQLDLSTGGLLTIDGVILTTDDRVLLTGGSTSFPNVSGSSKDNGIYLAKSGSWIRSADMPVGTAVSGYASFIEEGTIYYNTGFICSTSEPDIVGTDALQWVQFAGTSVVSAGDGLTKTGNTLDVNVDNVGIELSGGNLQLKDGGVVSSKLADTAVTAGSYGSSSQIPSITIDAKGRITSASNNSISVGDVYGPALSNDNAITRFDGTTGKLIQNSAAYVDDSGNISCNYLTSNVLTGTAPFTVNSMTVVANLKSDTVVTNANLTGPITSVGNTTSINSQTGTGSTFAMQTSPSLTTPDIGSATGTTLTNSVGSVSAPSYTFTGRTSTGVYSSAADTISISAGGTQILESTPTFINLPLTSSSTSSSLGALRTSGGISISNTTDASSSSNGGTFTTNGGVAIAKKLYVGFSSNATNHIDGYSTTATSGGTTILTVNSNRQQYFTGTLSHTVRMPATSTLVLGQSYTVINSSTDSVTVQSSGLNTITILSTDLKCELVCISNDTTTAADWSIVSDLSAASGNLTGDITSVGLTTSYNGIVPSTKGGTGVNNGSSTITLGGSLTTAGAFSTTLVSTGPTSVTLPASGTLISTTNGSSLTKIDDTNVTLTLGGSPSTSLVNAASLTLGWTGQLGLSRGGTNASLIASDGGIFYSTSSEGAILSGTATTGQVLRSGTSSAPSWSTATYPSTTVSNGILYSSGANNVTTLSSLTYDGTTLNNSNTTNSTNTTTGTIVTSGGAAIVKDLWVGGTETTDIAASATSVNLAYKTLASIQPLATIWTNNTSGVVSAVWRSVTWSPSLNLFVAVSHGVNTMRSSDGINWINSTSGVTSSNWTSVTWSPSLGLFVAVSSNSSTNTMRSSDGINWINSTSGVTLSDWSSVTWSPSLGLFVAVSFSISTNTMRSSDGINWINSTSGVTSSSWRSVAWSPSLGLFVAVSYSTNTMRSSDGINWINSTSGVVSANWLSVAWGSSLGLFVAISSGVSTNTMRSSDGINWINSTSGVVSSSWASVAWSHSLGLFVAISSGTNTMRSSDGINWINSTSGVVSAGWSSVIWSPYLGLFVAVSFGPSVNTMSSSKASITNTTNISSVLTTTNINGLVNITDSTSTENATNGALVVQGGVGVIQDINVGGSIYTQGNVYIGNTLIQGRNLLFNGNFQVAQKGSTVSVSSSSTVYTLDRWQLSVGANCQSTVFKSGSGICTIRRNNGETGTSDVYFCQSLTNDMCYGILGNYISASVTLSKTSTFTGGNITFTLYSGTGSDKSGINGSFIGSSVLISTSVAITTTPTVFTFTTSSVISQTVTQLAFQISWVPAGTAPLADSLFIKDACLTIGPYSINCQRLSYIEELIRCKYFYQRVENFSGYATTASIIQYSTGVQDMRSLPTMTVSGPIVITDGLANYTSSSTTIVNYGYQAIAAVSSFSGLTIFRPYIFNQTVNGNFIIYDSELV